MEVQAESEFIEVKSPIDRFKEEWGRPPDGMSFFHQRRFMLQNPDLVQYAEFAGPKAWIQPLTFATLALLLTAFVLSGLGWLVARDQGSRADEILGVRAELESQLRTEQAVVDASEFEMRRVEKSRSDSRFTVATSTNLSKAEAKRQLTALAEEAHKLQADYKLRAELKIQNLRAAEDGSALMAAGTPVIFSLALVLAAPIFRQNIQKRFGSYKLASQADDYYLYFVAGRGLWMNCIVVAALNLVLADNSYGLNGIGPVGKSLFCLVIYVFFFHWILTSSKDLYAAMQLPRPSVYQRFDNKVLLDIHSSFVSTFIVFEAVLGALAYGVYLVEKAT